MSRPLAVEARGLVKTYPGGVRALQGLDVEVPLGSLYCLAGPNGAGKTTFIRIASTITRPTAGRVYVMGYDVVEDVWRVRRLVAVMPQEGRPFTSALTVWEAVYYYLLARGTPAPTARAEARRTLEELDLWEHRDRLVMSLSGGLARRTLLAMVLATGADVVFLDEPTVGLDPVARRTTWGYIKKLAREGQTIVFSTHLLAEAESTADQVLLIVNGRKVAEGAPRKLVEKLPYKYKVVAPVDKLPPTLPEDAKTRSYGDLVYIYTRTLGEAMSIAEEIVAEDGEAQVKHVDLEDYFAEVVGSAS